jgi:hypothetical protein
MTELIINNQSPDDAIVATARSIQEQGVFDDVYVEDAVDNRWFIRATVGLDSLDDDRRDNLLDVVDELTNDDGVTIRTAENSRTNKYVVRVEY